MFSVEGIGLHAVVIVIVLGLPLLSEARIFGSIHSLSALALLFLRLGKRFAAFGAGLVGGFGTSADRRILLPGRIGLCSEHELLLRLGSRDFCFVFLLLWCISFLGLGPVVHAAEWGMLVGNRRRRLVGQIGIRICSADLLVALDVEIASRYLIAGGEVLLLGEDAGFYIVLTTISSRTILAQFAIEVTVVRFGFCFEQEDSLRFVHGLVVALADLLRRSLPAMLLFVAIVSLLLHLRQDGRFGSFVS